MEGVRERRPSSGDRDGHGGSVAAGDPSGHRPDRRRARHVLRGRARRDLRRDGPVGERQVDVDPLPVPVDRADVREGGRRGRGRDGDGSRHPARSAPHEVVDGLPALRVVPPPEGDRQRGLRLGGAADPQGGASRAGGRGARDRRPRPVGQSLPAAALRRDAAARRAGPGTRPRPRRVVLRRAVLRPRPPDPPGHAGRAVRDADAPAADDGVHHPRLRRGAAARRPYRDHEGRRARPGRDARGGRRRAGDELRARVHHSRPPGRGAHRPAGDGRGARLHSARRGLGDDRRADPDAPRRPVADRRPRRR